jgi:hypothetical protein
MLKYKFDEHLSSYFIRTDGQTDMTNLTDAFRGLVNVANKTTLLMNHIYSLNLYIIYVLPYRVTIISRLTDEYQSCDSS